jgi:hypothetical protein
VDVSWPTTDLELAAVQKTLNQAWSDGRWFIVWVPFIRYTTTHRTGTTGPGGYMWTDEGEQAWHRYVESMRPYLPRVIAFYLMDEPDAVASGDAPASGYDPNLYNPLIEQSIAVIRTDYPGARGAQLRVCEPARARHSVWVDVGRHRDVRRLLTR